MRKIPRGIPRHPGDLENGQTILGHGALNRSQVFSSARVFFPARQVSLVKRFFVR
jgi:hypothetical protein